MVSVTMLVQEILVSRKDAATGGDGVELAGRCSDGHWGKRRAKEGGDGGGVGWQWMLVTRRGKAATTTWLETISLISTENVVDRHATPLG